MVRQLHTESADNVVLIGGPGTGKSHMATALGVQVVEHHRKKVRFFSTVDLVNALEQEKAMNKASQLAERLLRLDLLILDELGYLPSSPSGGALLFHLLGKLHEQTSVVITTNLSFSEWAGVFGDAKMTTACEPRWSSASPITAISLRPATTASGSRPARQYPKLERINSPLDPKPATRDTTSTRLTSRSKSPVNSQSKSIAGDFSLKACEIPPRRCRIPDASQGSLIRLPNVKVSG